MRLWLSLLMDTRMGVSIKLAHRFRIGKQAITRRQAPGASPINTPPNQQSNQENSCARSNLISCYHKIVELFHYPFGPHSFPVSRIEVYPALERKQIKQLPESQYTKAGA